MEDVDLDEVDFEAEREMEQETQTAPSDEGGGVGAVQQQLALTADPFAFLKSVSEGSCRHVVVPHASYMPPLRGTKVPYTPCGTTTTTELDIEPMPNTQHAYGSITLAVPWMGGGKTSAKRDFQKVLIRESPDMRTLDIDCNRIYSVSNAVNLKKTAAELHAEGLKRVAAAGYLDEKQTVDLSRYQMVGCSFESLFKLSEQSFGLITADEVSALAVKVGGGTMRHFECVFVLRDLLNELGTRFLVLDAAAGFTMSPTEPSTVTQDFFKLVAPHRKVVSVALDPANMPLHLKRCGCVSTTARRKDNPLRGGTDSTTPLRLGGPTTRTASSLAWARRSLAAASPFSSQRTECPFVSTTATQTRMSASATWPTQSSSWRAKQNRARREHAAAPCGVSVIRHLPVHG